jgi:hypothetical protein
MPYPRKDGKPVSTTRTGSTAIHTILTRDGKTKTIKYGRKQAILLMCTECMGFDAHPQTCTAIRCPLYPFRGITRLSVRGD